MRSAIVSLAALLLASALASGKTLSSANNGSDSPSCGTADAPCRSIGQALANAADGDTIVVGPGYYGDLNRDHDFGDAGDEALASPGSGCLCMIPVTKRVILKSRDGADVTVIDAALVSRGLYFGAGSSGSQLVGFTIVGGADAIYADGNAGVSGLKLTGNVTRGGAGTGFGMYNGASGTLLANHAIGRGSDGFDLQGPATVSDAVAQSNAGNGIYTPFTGVKVQKSVLLSNGSFGFSVASGSAQLKNVSILANQQGGILYNSGTGSIASCTVSDNGRAAAQSCGIQNSGASDFTATGDFWGGPGGLGVAPSDSRCPFGVDVVTTPFKKTEVKVVPKAIR
ncbi:MAG TPA: right-handed parallel beta-helix repeat-containing protein [Myxococcota bacterium]|nr:right-handed parallel beta-helix repeat-containing protein [Myxococcota bacterium]